MKLVRTLYESLGSPTRRIELLIGDLTDIPEEHRVDLLVVSAFPGDYTPSESSLIGSLARRGLDVGSLALEPEFDLRRNFSCWISREITPPISGLSFNRVLCFEPGLEESPPEVVSGIFQAIAPFTYATPAIRSVAMPVVAAGDQGYSMSTMLPPLLDAAERWLNIGFPVHTIKLVLQTENALAEAISILQRRFTALLGLSQGGRDYSRDLPSLRPYDVFVSYSRGDEDAARYFTWHLQHLGLRVFFDRTEISVGAVWQQTIFDALESCSMLAALYSPDFITSKVCKEEFNIAWARGRESEMELIRPILLRDASLPTYMKMLNYLDCRVSDKIKLRSAAATFAEYHRLNKQISLGGEQR